MNKIIEKLLTVTFPTVEINNLMEIIEATPNPEIATEIICGLYQSPVLPKVVRETSGDMRELTLTSYNKWDDRVNYSFTKEKRINGYFPKGTLAEDITLDNFKEKKVEWGSEKDLVTIYIKTGELITDSSYCSSSTWLAYTIVD
jgi:hypothetical protein